MVELNDKCCGCGACEQICPQKCIRMQADGEGFLYPVIDTVKCVNCHLCEKSCPVLNVKPDSMATPLAYAAYCTDEKIRMNSSSGGIFTLLAEEILRQGGVVFGAAFDNDWTVHHVQVHSVSDLELLRGSKYLQSRTENTYTEVKTILMTGKPVLYSGTPCEIEGLYGYLGKEYEKLYTHDLICHGSPSPKVWGKYIRYHEHRAGAPARRMFFRHKKYGWKTYALSLQFSNDKAYEQILTKDLFMQMFLQNICLRPSCYHCSFRKINRISDITLADFWGCDEVYPELDDDKGCSVVLLHTRKGQQLFEAISERTVNKKVTLAQVLRGNPSMTESSRKPENRDAFMGAIDDLTIPQLAKEYLKKPTLKSVIGQMLPKKIRNRLKKMLGLGEKV